VIITDISKIDKNFAIDTNIDKDDIVYRDAREDCFKLYGLIAPDEKNGNDCYVRVPQDVAKATNDGTYWNNRFTAGGRLRFRTNSDYIAIHAELNDKEGLMPHMPATGSKCFDLYEKIDGQEFFVKAFTSLEGIQDQVYDFREKGVMHEITLNFPLYNGIEKLSIGLQESAVIEEPTPYINDKPVIFYGSSITQGGCASRPGTCYQGYITRRFNLDYLNLGFSGSSRGDKAMVEYMEGLPMSIFVLDYDHNAPNSEHLKKTHHYVYKSIRDTHPVIPIIMISKPDYHNIFNSLDCNERFEIIKKSYEDAVASGDKNVYLIDGRTFLDGLDGAEGSVDGCHPTDLGFYFMGKKIGDVIGEILAKEK